MARKIKKRPDSDRKKPVMQDRERQAVFAATFAVVIIDLLLIAVFPGLDSMIIPSAGSGGAAALKTIIIVVVDIALFISVFMILARRRKKQGKK